MNSFGEFFKEKRVALRKTLRQFCLEHGFDPGNISKLERGLLAPPQHEKLEEYARLLKLKKGSNDWYQFFDLAAAGSGKIPKDILDSEEMIQKLPVLFNALRGHKVSDAALDQVFDKMKQKKSARHPKIKIPKAEISEFCKRNRIRRLALFGSVLRDDFRPDSDVDVLVEFQPGHIPGLAFFRMQDELSRILKRRVDLHTPGFLGRHFRARVLSEAETQYDQAA
jgi:predicted nucleotidyltransferase